VDLCDHDALEDVFNTFRYAAVETLYNFCLCMLQIGFRDFVEILYNFCECCKLGLENYS
jgi:hypothetical protein